MMIQVVNQEAMEDGATHFELATEKKSISIYVGKSYTGVCLLNAAHSVWRGMGRTFHGEDGLQQALESYKDSHIKAMIETAIDLMN